MVEIMRFKKGSKVEVLTHKDVPSGSWRSAEIIGGNGHNYTVLYDFRDVSSFGSPVLERVPRKVIRPCPPSVDVVGDWVPGDVVEVFHNCSWKMATVLLVSGWSHVLVRLLGSSVELKAHKYEVRARLCWQDGEWIVIGKGSNTYEDMRFRVPSSLKNTGTIVGRGITGNCAFKKTIGVTKSQYISCRPVKRKPSEGHYQIDVYTGRSQKVRVSEEGSLPHQLNVARLSQLPEKVDDVACSQQVMGDGDGDGDGGFGCSRLVSLEPNDDNESISSSVGSCSVHNRSQSHKLHHHALTSGLFEDNDSRSSDIESFCQVRVKEGNCLLPPPKEELKDEIHRLELHAYRCTIEALHASGPLSWEQELLLTNLRDSLHISNEEHLREVRNLVSPSSCIPSS